MSDSLRAESVRAIIRSGTQAPSSHNTQPWLFKVSDRSIRLLADRSRALPVNDPHDRELTISCGCALMNLRIAAEDAGLVAVTRLFPTSDDSNLLAAVELRPATGSSRELARLAPVIDTRRTYRRKFADRDVSASTLKAVQEAVEAEGAWFRALSDAPLRTAVADLIKAGDKVQWSNPSWRRELAAWMRSGRNGDGLAVPRPIAPVVRAVVRTFDMGGVVGARDEDVAEEAPVLAVLGTETDDVLAWLRAGQALQRLLLSACVLGLQASFLNQPIQVAELRPRLREAIGEERPPQLLIRIGYPTQEVSRSPRRELDDVIVPS